MAVFFSMVAHLLYSQYRDAECPLRKGTGAVSKKLKPKMVQDGWEEA